ncbi:hypothetical protein BC834DRAFT_970987 [Gloeopeniophorella convolvens]|nr:hypothetical protein BC834DRAFT_970987 [Gloeopeniophorella convolvens]
MVVKCHNCAKVCKTNGALSIHLKKGGCKNSHTTISQLARSYHEALDLRKNEKKRLLEQEKENVPMDVDDAHVPPEDPPMDIPPPGIPHVDPHAHLELPPTRSGRRRRFPGHFQDFIPSAAAPASLLPPRPPSPPLPPPPAEPDEEEAPEDPPADAETARVVYRKTEPNAFGVFRAYTAEPTHDPDALISLEDLCDSSKLAVPLPFQFARQWWAGFGTSILESLENNMFAPFLNATSFRLMEWFYGNTMKSLADLDRLVNDVILADDFNREDLRAFSAARESRRMDEFEPPGLDTLDGWTKSKVSLSFPDTGAKHDSEDTAPKFEVEVHHREVLEVIKGSYIDVTGMQLHHTPHKLYWKDPDDPHAKAERLYSEIYNTDAMLEEHEKVKAHARAEGCTLETVVASICLWSDATHLTNFGSASLWPIYLFLGNLSKYVRGKPSSFSAHHLAYIPGLPDIIHEAYAEAHKRAPTVEILGLLKRDLVHAIWRLLLGAKFMAAYMHGVVVKCTDGVSRRIFPRFFIYSADYPEKSLLASIKNLGRLARARKWIFEEGVRVGGAALDRLLNIGSLAPIRSAFSEKLHEHGVNFYSLFVPDLLHEFELGVWKNTFIHLMRCLYDRGEDALAELNRRYRLVPTFGRGTIRRFAKNASGMKKLAARDFEDLLQCAMPVFEGLFPSPHNEIVLDMLFVLSTWHAYAKLRLHSESTLKCMEAVTTALGAIVRRFARTTCKTYKAKDLPREEAARSARRRRRQTGQDGDAPAEASVAGDNYSTQTGELEHRRVKRFYARTNKVQFTHQITNHEKRQRVLNSVRARLHGHSAEPGGHPGAPADRLPPTPPTNHYHISNDNRNKENVTSWLSRHRGDLAIQDCYRAFKSTFSHGAWAMLSTETSTLRINYTTYDMRRAQDTINPRTHADIMVLVHEDDAEDLHPYWYASREDGLSVGMKARRLPRIGFLPAGDPDYDAFGFLDPNEVIRASHLIPAFAYGQTEDFLPSNSVARHSRRQGDTIDYRFYYVSMWVDCNMFMRYVGGALGHKSTRAVSKRLAERMADALNIPAEEDDEDEPLGLHEDGHESDGSEGTSSEGEDPELEEGDDERAEDLDEQVEEVEDEQVRTTSATSSHHSNDGGTARLSQRTLSAALDKGLNKRKRYRTGPVAPYHKAARWIRRSEDPWIDFHGVFTYGFKATDPRAYEELVNQEHFTITEVDEDKVRQYVRIYKLLGGRIPTLTRETRKFIGTPGHMTTLASYMGSMVSAAISDDVGGLRDDGLSYVVSTWQELTPAIPNNTSKEERRGWKHQMCAELLCPVDHLKAFEDNPDGTISKLEQGLLELDSKQLCLFMYRDFTVDHDHLDKGLLESALLMKSGAYEKHVKSKRGQVELNGLMSVTPQSICYSAVHVRWFLCGVGDWRHEDGPVVKQELFNSLLGLFSEEGMEKWAKELLKTWNKEMFPPPVTASRTGMSSRARLISQQCARRQDSKVGTPHPRTPPRRTGTPESIPPLTPLRVETPPPEMTPPPPPPPPPEVTPEQPRRQSTQPMQSPTESISKQSKTLEKKKKKGAKR